MVFRKPGGRQVFLKTGFQSFFQKLDVIPARIFLNSETTNKEAGEEEKEGQS